MRSLVWEVVWAFGGFCGKVVREGVSHAHPIETHAFVYAKLYISLNCHNQLISYGFRKSWIAVALVVVASPSSFQGQFIYIYIYIYITRVLV